MIIPPHLTIELVPKTCWFTNVRSCVSSTVWNRLRRLTYEQAGYKCEVCGYHKRSGTFHAHEVWFYDDDEHIQKLVALICLCPDCHEVKHIGLARIKGNWWRCIDRLSRINSYDRSTSLKYVDQCFTQWRIRSQHEWTLDISWLEEHLLEGEKVEEYIF